MASFSQSISSLKSRLIQERECGNLHEESRLCHAIGKRFEEQEKYHLALKYHLCDLEISESIPDTEGICMALGNIANIYVLLRMFSSSFERQQRRIEIAKSNAIYSQEFHSYIGMGWLFHQWALSLEDTYVDFGYLEKSIEFYELALNFAITKNFSLENVLDAQLRLAHVYYDIGEDRRANELIDEIRRHTEDCNVFNSDFLNNVYCSLIDYFLKCNNYDLAIENQRKYLRLAQTNCNLSCELDAISWLGRIFLRKGLFQESYDCFSEYKALCLARNTSHSIASLYNEEQALSLRNLEKFQQIEKRLKNVEITDNNELFYWLDEISDDYESLEMKEEALSCKQKQCILIQQSKISLSPTELQEFFHDYGSLLEEIKAFPEAHQAYKTSLEFLNSILNENPNDLCRHNKSNLLCGIGNAMDSMNFSSSAVICTYKEALEYCDKPTYGEDYYRILRNLYEAYYNHRLLQEAREIQQRFRNEFLIQEVAVTEMEKEEIESFSYFSNRKPSKKMKSLIGNYVMKSKKLNASGLNLKGSKKKSSKRQDDEFKFTSRTSMPIVYKKAINICQSDSESLSDFIENDSIPFRHIQKISDSSQNGDDSLSDENESKRVDVSLHPESSFLSPIRNASTDIQQQNSSDDNTGHSLISESFLEEAAHHNISNGSEDCNQLESFSNFNDVLFPLNSMLMQKNESQKENTLDNLYRSKIKFYNCFPNVKILDRLSNCKSDINLSNLLLDSSEFACFFNFLDKEFPSTINVLNLSGNSLTENEISMIFKNTNFSVNQLLLGRNLLTSSILPCIEKSFDLSVITILDLSFLNLQNNIPLFLQFLSSLYNLQVLVLKSCNLSDFDDDNLKSFLEQIIAFHNLSLDISYNNFSSVSLKNILRTISFSLNSLLSLDLSGIDLSSIELVSYLKDLYLCPKLSSLKVDNCNLSSFDFVLSLIEKNIFFSDLQIGNNPSLSCHQWAEFFTFLKNSPKKLHRLGINGTNNAEFILNEIHQNVNSIGIKEYSFLELSGQLIEFFIESLTNVNFYISFDVDFNVISKNAMIHLRKKFPWYHIS